MESRHQVLRWLVPAVLVGTAALLMVATLSTPNRIVFDETYYVNDARDFLERGVEEGFVVHPPLGKQLIALSIRALGDTPFGWRALGAVAGVACVLLTYLIGLRLFRRQTPAALSALLLALDGVFLVQARSAMLDIYLAFFVTLGAWALVVDRDRVRAADDAMLRAASVADPPPGHPRLPRPSRRYLLLAGAAFGAAVATKWSGALALVGAGLLVLGWELGRRRRVGGSARRQLGRLAATFLGALVILPVAVYATTWIPWMLNFSASHEGAKQCTYGQECGVGIPGRLAALGRFHKAMIDFHFGLEADHPYRAPAYAWPTQARPVVFYYETCTEDHYNRVPSENDDGEMETPDPCRVEQGQAAEMLALGNPALWWLYLPVSALLAAGLRRRDRVAALPFTFHVVQFLPWLIVARPQFSFYAVPFVPFLALGMGAGASYLLDRRPLWRIASAAAISAGATALTMGLLDLAGRSFTRPTYGIVIGVAWLVGALVGDALTPEDWRGLPGTSEAARWIIAAVAVAAVGLAMFFLPVWLGLPLSTDLIRQRWWFRGWI